MGSQRSLQMLIDALETQETQAQAATKTQTHSKLTPTHAWTQEALPPLPPSHLCDQGKCDIDLCKRNLYRKGTFFLRQLRQRHPELEQDRDRFLKSASKLNRRRNKYPAKAKELHQKIVRGEVPEEDLHKQPTCIQRAYEKLKDSLGSVHRLPTHTHVDKTAPSPVQSPSQAVSPSTSVESAEIDPPMNS
eukprot:m.34885 g.34885  ORF g.34885 m.34885 type:complete len:190 (+) comp43784_c0_seq1:139-708(+)